MKKVLGILVSIALLFVGAPVWAEETEQPTVLNVVDLRWSPSVNWAEYYRIDENGVILPDVYRLELPNFDYTEYGVGGGAILLQGEHVTIGTVVYFSAGSNGERWLQPALSILWNDGDRLSGSVFVAYYAPLNDLSPEEIVVNPADVEYKLDESWGLGASLTAVSVAGEWETKLGPMLRYRHDAGWLELRAAEVSPGDSWELQLRHQLEF